MLLKSKPVRTVLWWQIMVTAAIALIALPFAGAGGALSAALGGAINAVAGLAFFAVAGAAGLSAGEIVVGALRAEACKILVIVVALCGVLFTVKGIAFVPFFAAFALTALMPSVGLLVHDDSGPSGNR